MIDVSENIKNALRSGYCKKNVIIQVFDKFEELDFEITNENLQSESLVIDEKMCSADTLKFGLSEGTSLEFVYFDKPMITNRLIKLFIEVVTDDDEKERIDFGFFTVDRCAKQASTGLIRCTAYNKLQSKYLNVDVTGQIKEDYENTRVLELVNRYLNQYYSLEGIDVGKYRIESKDIRWNSKYIFSTKNDDSLFVMSIDVLVSHTQLDTTKFYSFEAKPRILLERVIDSLEYKDTPLNGYANLKEALRSNHVWYISVSEDFKAGKSENILSKNHDYEYKTISNGYSINELKWRLTLPLLVKRIPFHGDYPTYPNLYLDDIQEIKDRLYSVFENYPELLRIRELNSDDKLFLAGHLEQSSIDSVTLRDIANGFFELKGEFGRIDTKSNFFHGAKLSKSALLPNELLYPNNGLYPQGAFESSDRTIYKSLYTNEIQRCKFKTLYLTYRRWERDSNGNLITQNGKNVSEIVNQIIVLNSDGNVDYDLTSNWILNNYTFDDETIDTIINNLVSYMKGIEWLPFDMDLVGLPYLETGDMIEVTDSTGTYNTYILERRLKGIQNLEDSYSCGQVDIF